jgi:hypothetical protein
MPSKVTVGLCAACAWVRTTTARSGATYYRCARAEQDPRFPRYPALPVRRCPGYAAAPTASPADR